MWWFKNPSCSYAMNLIFLWDIRPLKTFPLKFGHKHFVENIKVELDLSYYATKNYLKNVTSIDTFNLAAKADLASFLKNR